MLKHPSKKILQEGISKAKQHMNQTELLHNGIKLGIFSPDDRWLNANFEVRQRSNSDE